MPDRLLSSPLPSPEEKERLKRQAAEFAVDRFVESGMVVGLGVGSTAIWALRRLAEMVASGALAGLLGVPCSLAVEAEARRLGLPLTTLEAHPVVDVTIDGADEVDPALNLIKGGGGALLREKVVAQASRREVIVIDPSKRVPALGARLALPVEVLPFALGSVRRFLESLGGEPRLRVREDGAPFTTDQGNYILDTRFPSFTDPHTLAVQLDARAGLIAHGLFLELANDLIVAHPEGVIQHLRRGGPETWAYPTPAALAEAAAERIVQAAQQAIAARGRFTLALSGGSTPRATYRRLASLPLDWARVHLFWGDERAVPPDDPQSNYRMAREALIDHVSIPAGNVHRIPAELPPEEAARRYQAELEVFFGGAARFDLVLLGLGADGHTASLFPGVAVPDDRLVAAVHVPQMDTWRITLTPKAINAAQEIVFLVSGAGKRPALRAVQDGPHQPDHLPAQTIRREAMWLCDREAVT